jgi:hypothetical protein
VSLTLSAAELRELTGRTRSDGQCRELRAMGIPFKMRRDGSPAVLRVVAELALGARGTTIRETEPEVLP